MSKMLSDAETVATSKMTYKLPEPNISSIKNKERRRTLYREMKRETNKMKKKEKKKRKGEAKALGDAAPPKQVPKTLDNMRVHDETMVNPGDEEVLLDELQDEMAPYFNRETNPKLLVTTCDKPTRKSIKFCKDLRNCIPNTDFIFRHRFDIKKIITQATARNYTDLIIVNEDQKIPNGLVLCHLPNGPTAHFKLTNVRIAKELKRRAKLTHHLPEIILNNFNTRLGHSVGRLLASLFPHDPQFDGRRVITFHNQRDFIFFRHHRYKFRDQKKCGIQEVGPRFTLKLRSLQKGTFDSKFGEYEWFHKRHEMETSRRKFFL